MSRSFFRACLMTAIYFVGGFLCSPVAIGIWKAHFVAPVERQQEKEAYSFFYRTMMELSKGTYDPESGLIREDALNEYKKYADQLGGMCQTHLKRDSADNFVGQAFFPSGDIFDIYVFRSNERLMLLSFFHKNWESVWSESLDRCGVSDTKQGRGKPVD